MLAGERRLGRLELPFGLALEKEFIFLRAPFLSCATTGGSLFTGGETHNCSIMTNGYYRLHNSTPLTPYLGACVGGADDLKVAPIYGLDKLLLR
jgi:hypothetical protein